MTKVELKSKEIPKLRKFSQRENNFKRSKNSEKIKKIVRNKKSDEIDKKKLEKYFRGRRPDAKHVKTKFEQKKLQRRENKIKYGLKQSVKSEALLTEDSGYLIPDENEVTSEVTQTDIKNSVDPLSASKQFDLDLKFGSYRMNYTRNGRFLLIGGRKGHVAAMDWIGKKLLCEINVMESTHDVAWLHQETLFAVAQKKWVYVYDNQGVEIHCVKNLYNVIRMTFLPYHFLLATVSSNNFISWLDVSIGEMVEQFHLRSRGTASTIAQHPGNAMICVGEPTGCVSFWSPNCKKPAVTKLCHRTPICAVAFDPRGINFATAGIDSRVKIWDARNLNGPMRHYPFRTPPKCISLSHRGTLAVGLNNVVEIYNDTVKDGKIDKEIYLKHRVPRTISNMEFCPFEDILGVAHLNGFTSMLVPGCGEPNFDALEINPFQSNSQRKEAEVKALLNKIPSDLITWDTTELRKIDIPSLEEIIAAKKQINYIKPPDIQFTPRNKRGKHGGSANAVNRKKIMKAEFKKNYVKQIKALNNDRSVNAEEKETKAPKSVLDRFKTKVKN